MILAKSNPVETLGEHTRELIERYEKLKRYYGDYIPNETVWRLLYLAALYHDIGKAYSHFQYRIKKSLNHETKPISLPDIPHNYLSPFSLPLRHLKLNKHLRRVLVESITYHHERERLLEVGKIREIAEIDLIEYFEDISQDFATVNLSIKLPENTKAFNTIESDLKRQRIKFDVNNKFYFKYALVKGLLHRLDHAASANVDIEIDYDYCFATLTKNYLKKLSEKNKDFLRPLQQFTLKNQQKNLILVAQTGMGKTEAALLWAGKKKTFFTVPLRVSLNALYNRVQDDMGYTNCGLLHSTSAHYLDELGLENWEIIHDQSKHFASKLTFTTIDQILKFPFKFRGYEKYYATLAYSCVVIDEIQAYSPWVVAVVIKAIEMIHYIGGRFMIMTATLPTIYLDELIKREIIDDNTIIKKFYDDR